MTGLVEKNYAEALFQVICEEQEEKLGEVLSELKAIKEILDACPDFIKLADTPTVELSDKLSIMQEAFQGRVSPYVYNFIRVLCQADRLDRFGGILTCFNALYNEKFGIADIVVTTSVPLSDSLREKVIKRMEQVTGKKINMTERVDKSIIGGIVVNYGDTLIDGSVKARLDALKSEISRIVC
ncbi:MAG: ATP synthase F1 subunit delta [Ruminiclostridium sp.]